MQECGGWVEARAEFALKSDWAKSNSSIVMGRCTARRSYTARREGKLKLGLGLGLRRGLGPGSGPPPAIGSDERGAARLAGDDTVDED